MTNEPDTPDGGDWFVAHPLWTFVVFAVCELLAMSFVLGLIMGAGYALYMVMS